MRFTTLTTVFLLALGAGVAGQEDTGLPGESGSDTGSVTIEPITPSSEPSATVSISESESYISSLPSKSETIPLPSNSTSRSVSSKTSASTSASTSRSVSPSPIKSGPSETVTAPPKSGALAGVTVEFGGIAIGVLGIVAAIL